MSGIAICRTCDEQPLVGTFVFYKKEFICLRCGMLYGWMQPSVADETPDLLKKMESLILEWKQNASAICCVGMKLIGCQKCSTTGDSHRDHWTEEEEAADLEGRKWVNERTGKELFRLEVAA